MTKGSMVPNITLSEGRDLHDVVHMIIETTMDGERPVFDHFTKTDLVDVVNALAGIYTIRTVDAVVAERSCTCGAVSGAKDRVPLPVTTMHRGKPQDQFHARWDDEFGGYVIDVNLRSKGHGG